MVNQMQAPECSGHSHRLEASGQQARVDPQAIAERGRGDHRVIGRIGGRDVIVCLREQEASFLQCQAAAEIAIEIVTRL